MFDRKFELKSIRIDRAVTIFVAVAKMLKVGRWAGWGIRSGPTLPTTTKRD